jgi:hypothetical protein
MPEKTPESKTASDLNLLLKAAWLPSFLLCAGFGGLMLANTLFIFWELLQSSKTPLSKALQILWSSSPAILVICAPLLLLWPAALFLRKREELGFEASFSSRRLFSLLFSLALFLSAMILLVQEKIVPPANQATVKCLQDLMLEGRDDDMIFSEKKDIRQMSAQEAWLHLNQKSSQPPPTAQNWIDFYNKFSLSLTSLAFAIWGLLAARLTQHKIAPFWLIMATIGTVLPILFWYFVYTWSNIAGSASHIQPLLASFLPIFSLGGVGLIGFVFLSYFQRNLSKS